MSPQKTETIMMDLHGSRVSVMRNHQACIWMCTHVTRPQWDAKVYIRGLRGAIHYLNRAYHAVRPTSTQLYFDTYREGLVSARPFQLGQDVDASCECSLISLLLNYCRYRGIDYTALCVEATLRSKGLGSFDEPEVQQQAQWEGTLYPRIWTPPDVRHLTKALIRVRWEPLWAQQAVRQTSRH
jgi:hypothetical protein